MSNSLSCCPPVLHLVAVAIDDEQHVVHTAAAIPRLAVGLARRAHPVVVAGRIAAGGVSMPYGVQGLAPSGSGSSPRIAIQTRSGVSAYTRRSIPTSIRRA